MILFIQNIPDKYMHRDKKWIEGFQELGGGSKGSDYLMGMAFSIEVINCFGVRWRLWLCNMVNILSTAELHTLE